MSSTQDKKYHQKYTKLWEVDPELKGKQKLRQCFTLMFS